MHEKIRQKFVKAFFFAISLNVEYASYMSSYIICYKAKLICSEFYEIFY